jgi:predicted transglutaminase-like cysteine proteinase
MSDSELQRLNRYWNNKIRYTDYGIGGRTTEEAIENGGKCSDYVRAKATGLKNIGYDPESIKIGIGHADGVPHSVLLADGMVLDNMYDDLQSPDDYDRFEFLPYTLFDKD